DKCGVDKNEEENPSVDVIGERKVKLLTIGTWVEHELNGIKVEQKRRIKDFKKSSKRRRKRRRLS
ncbi:hypothetical protein HAX54_020448, partial [Datura stramonium]|nr:hypothetical protein [Datura stramonium]